MGEDLGHLEQLYVGLFVKNEEKLVFDMVSADVGPDGPELSGGGDVPHLELLRPREEHVRVSEGGEAGHTPLSDQGSLTHPVWISYDSGMDTCLWLTNDVPESELPGGVSPVGEQGESEEPRVLELGPQHPELLVVKVPDSLHSPGHLVVEEDPGDTLGVPRHGYAVPLNMKVGLPLTRVADPEQVIHLSHTRWPYFLHSPGHKLSTLLRPDDHRCLCHPHQHTRPCLQWPNSSPTALRLQHVLQNLQRVRARVHEHVTRAGNTAVHVEAVTRDLAYRGGARELGEIWEIARVKRVYWQALV